MLLALGDSVGSQPARIQSPSDRQPTGGTTYTRRSVNILITIMPRPPANLVPLTKAR